MDFNQLLVESKYTPETVLVAEYIWIDAEYGLRSKSRTLPIINENTYKNVEKIPTWSYDGSSTNQAVTKDSDITIKPVASFTDPFRGFPHILVLCETYNSDGEPLPSNHRSWANEIFDISTQEHCPWYGIEQEFFLMTPNGRPIGFPSDGYPKPQGKYYCGVGANNIFGREIMDELYQHCIMASIKISGVNAEVANSQWEFQIGPCSGLEVGDHLWVARYILNRLAEKYGAVVDYHPKPLEGSWNGSGLHTNFSTHCMRDKGGIKDIKMALKKLEMRHEYHMKFYGSENYKRMTGGQETSSFYKFNWGIRDRSASVRIPPGVAQSGQGYLEDRRPASNADPYLVAGLIYETVVHND